MQIDSCINKILYIDTYKKSCYEVIDKFIYDYQDEFALNKFLLNHHDALEKLKYVNAFDGRPSDKTLLELGLRRMKIKRSKDIIIYTYKNGNIWLHSIQYAGRDFAKVFY